MFFFMWVFEFIILALKCCFNHIILMIINIIRHFVYIISLSTILLLYIIYWWLYYLAIPIVGVKVSVLASIRRSRVRAPIRSN